MGNEEQLVEVMTRGLAQRAVGGEPSDSHLQAAQQLLYLLGAGRQACNACTLTAWHIRPNAQRRVEPDCIWLMPWCLGRWGLALQQPTALAGCEGPLDAPCPPLSQHTPQPLP